MPESGAFLYTLAVVCSVAAFTTVLCQRIRLPVVFGYLLAGMIVGPYVPIPLIADTKTVSSLAEVGVVLLMFSIGLEFSLRRMLRLAPVSGLVTLVVATAMFGLGVTAAELMGWTAREAVFTGAMLTVSSSTIIARAFREHPVERAVRDTVYSITVFEDLVGILLLAALSAVGRGGELSMWRLGSTVLQLLTFLAALIGIGLLVVPRFMRSVARLRNDETTLVTAVGLAFAAALLAVAFGYSVALGAFIMGALVAESGAQQTVEKLLSPLRDFFAAVFFTSVGMSIDPSLVASHWGAALFLTALVIVGKVLAASVTIFFSGRDVRTSIAASMSLAQIGEFAFIIVGVGAASGAIGDHLLPVAVAVSALTTLATPVLTISAAGVAARIDRALPAPLQTFVALYGSWFEAMRRGGGGPQRSRIGQLVGLIFLDIAVLLVLVVATAVEMPRGVMLLQRWTGAGPQGAQLGVLAIAALAAAPLVLGLVRTAGRLGEKLAERALPNPQRGADFGFAPRRALAVSLQGGLLVLAGFPVVAVAQPFLPPLRGTAVLLVLVMVIGVVVWRSATNLQGHAEAGAQLLVSALRHQMAETGVYPVPQPIARANELLPGMGAPVAVAITGEHAAAGQTLRALNVRARTGAGVLAITRGEERILIPRGGDQILAGDVIALAGTREAVAAAISLLTAPVPHDSE
ncbi:MAG: cation:proton antiporter [Gemmatimonadaceae bacterium]|nr:cation:proton antiporter [Gemmatimonadaceae bacterium]